MSFFCPHGYVYGRCPEGDMGAVPPSRPFRPNLDRFGLPRDYDTYVWATYGPGKDLPPERREFLYGVKDGSDGPWLPAPDPDLMGTEWR